NVQGRQNQNQNQRYAARGNGVVGKGGGGVQNRAGNANASQGKPVKCYNCNGVGHIAKNWKHFDADVDNQLVQDLALNEENIFQADECDAFDSDVDDEPIAQTIFMANLSLAGSANPQAGPSNASI
ncbi:retrovirus-related pol polyprotein from transposon TNT 1-94, partial [Tanacetum coccineum]